MDSSNLAGTNNIYSIRLCAGDICPKRNLVLVSCLQRQLVSLNAIMNEITFTIT